MGDVPDKRRFDIEFVELGTEHPHCAAVLRPVERDLEQLAGRELATHPNACMDTLQRHSDNVEPVPMANDRSHYRPLLCIFFGIVTYVENIDRSSFQCRSITYCAGPRHAIER
ncbi:hypothetical protein [Burkholderia sp. Ac-20344]|uniref:hypothetical protein n=1 Tax=Burkholderia sp. Ac-20344 TaxID=2703890 RepID=UPI00197B96CD|nr:hypothetical protein [Burkholderia sp. Ac-20344]MBN3835322.1 hypothetical protein [Burkholderia sp. Ac-20344]